MAVREMVNFKNVQCWEKGKCGEAGEKEGKYWTVFGGKEISDTRGHGRYFLLL